jgi:anthranilate synthase component II
MLKLLLIDNYDSFTWNLVQILRESGLCSYDVVYNDSFSIEACAGYDKILISPGPGLPDEAGIVKEAIKYWAGEKSFFGVCLGHQAIGMVFGAQLSKLPLPRHGSMQQTLIQQSDALIFRGLNPIIQTGHYHSWVLRGHEFPDDLRITATDGQGNIMAIQHKNLKLHGVQFHPESIMTPDGAAMIRNWLLE